MKICIDLTSIYNRLTGIEKYALNISKHMLLNDTKNEYVLIFKKEVHPSFEFIKARKNIKYKIINFNKRIVVEQIILPFYLYLSKSDVYIFLAFPCPALFFSKKTVSTIFDMTPWIYPDTMEKKGLIYFKILIKLAILRSKLILTDSYSAKQDIQKFYNYKNINVIYPGVDEKYRKLSCSKNKIQEVKNLYNLPDKYILCLGTLEPRKNVALLIKAFIKLKNETDFDYKLVLTGTKGWMYDSLLNMIDKNEIRDEIIFTGFIKEEDLPFIYYLSDCLVFPSIYEGFGMPLVEAMATGTPVISSDTSSMPEVLGEGEILFKSNSELELSKALKKFVELSDLQKENIEQYGYKRAELFNWNVESKKLIAILNKNFNSN